MEARAETTRVLRDNLRAEAVRLAGKHDYVYCGFFACSGARGIHLARRPLPIYVSRNGFHRSQ
jgi:hypothetical protein